MQRFCVCDKLEAVLCVYPRHSHRSPERCMHSIFVTELARFSVKLLQVLVNFISYVVDLCGFSVILKKPKTNSTRILVMHCCNTESARKE